MVILSHSQACYFSAISLKSDKLTFSMRKNTHKIMLRRVEIISDVILHALRCLKFSYNIAGVPFLRDFADFREK